MTTTEKLLALADEHSPADRRFGLFTLREIAWQLITEIDHTAMQAYLATAPRSAPRRTPTIDDLEI